MKIAIYSEKLVLASIKAICVTCMPFTVYFTTVSSLSVSVETLGGVFFLALVLFIFFVMYSFVGWLIIGLPTHWFINTRFRGHKRFYFVVIGLLWLATFLWSDARAATITTTIAISQLLLFLYWNRKNPQIQQDTQYT